MIRTAVYDLFFVTANVNGMVTFSAALKAKTDFLKHSDDFSHSWRHPTRVHDG